jgi:hypothetical protein
MADENEILVRTLKAGFKSVLVVLMQIRDKKEGKPTNEITSDASKLFSQTYGE